MARHNWDEIKKEYVEGISRDGKRVYPTQRELADKYNIDPAVIGRKAKQDQWSAQREIFASKVSAERQQKTIEVISDEGSKFDLDCFNAAKTGIEKIQKGIGQCFLVEDINKLSAALKNFQAVGKASLGDKGNNDNALTIEVTLKDADT